MKLIKMQKIAAILTALCISIVPVAAEQTVDNTENTVEQLPVSGEGTQESPYVIKDAAGLAYLETLTNSGATKSVYFELGNDIVLNDISLFALTEGEISSAAENAAKWTPVGSAGKPFEGVLDGKGHYITGLYCDTTNSVGGLFGILDGAVVKNLNMDFALVEAGEYSGLVAGKALGESQISDCVVSGSVIGKKQMLSSVVGGVAGFVDGGAVVSDCCFYGAVTGPNAFASNVGGIAGLNNGVVEKCNFGGKAFGVSMFFSANVGGVAGTNHGEIKGCQSQGTVGAEGSAEVNDSNAGGIAGFSDGSISQCKNTSVVSGYCASFGDSIGTAGGIAGYVKNSDVYGCENDGEILGEQGVYAGGIAGLTVVDDGEHKIYDCLNNGKITSDYGVGGGIVARISASGYASNKNELVSCVNTADVSGGTPGGVAGIVYAEGASVTASACYYASGYPDGFGEGSAPVASAGFTSGTALEGLTNANVWVFESGKLPDMIFAEDLAKSTSSITAESSQFVTSGNTVSAAGTGTMSLSREMTGTFMGDVIVRFSGDENTFAPRPVVVNVTVVNGTDELSILKVDASALTVNEGSLSGTVKVQMYGQNDVEGEYMVVNSVFVDGVYASSSFTPVTAQEGMFEQSFDITSVSVAEGAVVSVNTMIVESTESMAPVCENVVVEVDA